MQGRATLLAGLAALGCAPGGPADTGETAGAARSTEAVAAGSSPLILYDAPEGQPYMEALTGGTLVRDGECVYLDHGAGDRSLVVFPSPTARWDEASGTVRFGPRTLRFGEEAAFGGGEVPLGDTPQAAEARRRGCETRRVWWASPALVARRPRFPAPAPPPPPPAERGR